MKISERGQVTIPKSFREKYGLNQDVEVEFVAEREGVLIRKRSLKEHPIKALYGILKRKSSTDKYIEEVRGR